MDLFIRNGGVIASEELCTFVRNTFVSNERLQTAVLESPQLAQQMRFLSFQRHDPKVPFFEPADPSICRKEVVVDGKCAADFAEAVLGVVFRTIFYLMYYL